jgi:hypothetical protein
MGFVLIIIGILMMGVSAFYEPPRFSLWRCGWTLVLLGLLVFGGDYAIPSD